MDTEINNIHKDTACLLCALCIGTPRSLLLRIIPSSQPVLYLRAIVHHPARLCTIRHNRASNVWSDIVGAHDVRPPDDRHQPGRRAVIKYRQSDLALSDFRNFADVVARAHHAHTRGHSAPAIFCLAHFLTLAPVACCCALAENMLKIGTDK